MDPNKLQQAISYAQENPTSPYALELRNRIESGSYNTELASLGMKSDFGRQNLGTGFEPTEEFVSGETGRNIGRAFKNIPRSARELGQNILTAVTKPRQTIQSIAGITRGAAQKAESAIKERTPESIDRAFDRVKELVAPQLAPGRAVTRAIAPVTGQEEETFDQVADFFKERYGSIEGIKETAVEDPVGFLADVATLVTGAGATVRAAGTAGKIGEVTRVGGQIQRAGQALEPITAASKGVGRVTGALTPKVQGLLPKVSRQIDEEVVQIAKQRDIELPASAISKSSVPGLFESLAARGVFGAKTRTRVQNALDKITKIADDQIANIRGVDDPSLAGKSVIDGIEASRDNFTKIKNELYANIEKGIEGVEVSTDSTVSALRDIIQRKSDVLGVPENVPFYQSILDDIETGGAVSFEKLKKTRTAIGKKLKNRQDPVTAADQAELNRMYAAISDDLDTAAIAADERLADSITKANKFYADNVKELNAAFAKKVFNLKESPSKVIRAITSRSAGIEDTNRLLDLMGDEAKVNVQATLMKEIFDGAKSQKTGQLTPSGIDKMVNKLGRSKVEAIFSPEQVRVLDDLDKLSNAMAKPARFASGSQTAFISRLFGEFVLGFAIDPTIALKVIAGDFLLSNFMGSKLGQRVLVGNYNIGGNLYSRLKQSSEKGEIPASLLKEMTDQVRSNASDISSAAFQVGRLSEQQ